VRGTRCPRYGVLFGVAVPPSLTFLIFYHQSCHATFPFVSRFLFDRFHSHNPKTLRAPSEPLSTHHYTLLRRGGEKREQRPALLCGNCEMDHSAPSSCGYFHRLVVHSALTRRHYEVAQTTAISLSFPDEPPTMEFSSHKNADLKPKRRPDPAIYLVRSV